MLDLDQIQSFYPEEIRPFRTNILREYLQHKILESLFRSRHGAGLSFMGGTCIHLIHGSPRFSEDLDFDNGGISPDEFGELAEAVTRDLQLEGYTVELSTSFKGAFRAFFRFPAILLGKTRANMVYLSAKLGVRSADDLKDRLLTRGAELDMEQLAADIEPFVIRAQDTDRVLLFPDYIASHL